MRQQRTRESPFSTVALRQAQSPSSTAADLDFLDEPATSRQDRQSTSGFPKDIDARTAIDNLLDGIVPNSRSQNIPRDSASDVRSAFQSSRNTTIRTRQSRSPGELASMMKFPTAPGASASQSTERDRELMQEIKNLRVLNPRNKRTIRSRPTVGRTIELDPGRGMDFGRAMRQLNILCATNKVRADAMRQRFHERPGMKRKRLKSERWRKLFKEGFRATVGRVKEMRRKGW
ncbi:MAG: hypothetical protein Q9163_002406 [Psora crenata]